MLIPVLHFEANCIDAISVYEKRLTQEQGIMIIATIIKSAMLKWLSMDKKFFKRCEEIYRRYMSVLVVMRI